MSNRTLLKGFVLAAACLLASGSAMAATNTATVKQLLQTNVNPSFVDANGDGTLDILVDNTFRKTSTTGGSGLANLNQADQFITYSGTNNALIWKSSILNFVTPDVFDPATGMTNDYPTGGGAAANPSLPGSEGYDLMQGWAYQYAPTDLYGGLGATDGINNYMVLGHAFTAEVESGPASGSYSDTGRFVVYVLNAATGAVVHTFYLNPFRDGAVLDPANTGVGDFNGDGKDDLVVTWMQWGTWTGGNLTGSSNNVRRTRVYNLTTGAIISNTFTAFRY